MSTLTDRLATSFRSLGVTSTYGSPVEVEGTTIVPVSLTVFGFGAGEGSSNSSEAEGGETGSGSGGGGGGYALPVGAYVKRDGELRFDPNPVTLLMISLPLVVVTGRVLVALVRALKK
jgi:uncharacterized spore protein YtfJ